MLMAYPCMYTYNKVKFSLLFWVVSSSVPPTRNPDAFRSRSWNTINSSTHVRDITAIQHGCQNTRKPVWNMANSAAINKFYNNCVWTMWIA